jgi:membrane protease YdiL (CAAX protease family)
MTNDLTIPSLAVPVVRPRKFRGFMARHDLAFFFVLAFLFSWYPWVIALLRGTASGPNPLGPFIAALLVTGLTEGRSGMRTLFGRIVRARIGWPSYAIIFGLPILLCAIAVAMMAPFGQRNALPTAAALRELPERFVFIFLFIGLGEEPGWRGFALPRLQKAHSPWIASLILAPIWALWHLPLMGNEFPAAIIPAFLISLVGGTLVQTWLFNRSKGSVFAQMLFHATVNTVGAGLIFPLMKGPAFVPFWYVYALLWLAAGVTVIFSSAARVRPASR